MYKEQSFVITPVIDFSVFAQSCTVAFWLENADVPDVAIDHSSGTLSGSLKREGSFALNVLNHISCKNLTFDINVSVHLKSITGLIWIVSLV